MSRRQSRVSIEARQNDTLLEFENCACSQRVVLRPRHSVHAISHSFSHAFPVKKKFLLANKHITKCVWSPLLH